VGPVPLTVGMIASQCGRIAPTVWARTLTVWAVFPHSVGVFPHSVGESRPHCEGFPPHYTSQCDVQCDTLTWSVTLGWYLRPSYMAIKRESIHTGLKERADLHAANHACAGRRSPERRLWGIHFRKVCNSCEWLITDACFVPARRDWTA